ncbi:unnamed protein product [Merluccius merluccius]
MAMQRDQDSPPGDWGVSSVNQPGPAGQEEEPGPPERGPWLLRPSWRSWSTAALVGAVWSVCQVEAPLHPSLGPAEAARRLLWSGGLWAGLGVGTLLLWSHWRGRSRPATAIRSDAVAEQKNISHISWVPRVPGGAVSLDRVLADGLLLCVLQEPLCHPSLAHIEVLQTRLQAVSQTLQRAEGLAGTQLDRQDPTLVEAVKALNSYLQQRSLGGLVRVQGELEAGLEDLLGGLEGLWTRLVELHTRVTLTKDWSRGQGDLAGTRAEAESVSRLVGQYRTRVQVCQDCHRDATQLLQLDNVQESFQSLDQQTRTFQAHLDGLDRGSPDGQATRPPSCSSSSTSTSSSSSSACKAAPTVPHHGQPAPDPSPAISSLDDSSEAQEDGRWTLCERSASHFSSTFGRLRSSSSGSGGRSGGGGGTRETQRRRRRRQRQREQQPLLPRDRSSADRRRRGGHSGG